MSDLKNIIHDIYEKAASPISNEELYMAVADKTGLSTEKLNAKSAIGKSGDKHSKVKRKIRWYQQTLKSMNLLKRVEGKRGVWELAARNKKGLHEAAEGACLVAYSTRLGVAVWSDNHTFFSGLNEPVHLCVTSPPYPLRIQRGYGNVSEMQYVDFITRALEPIVKNLVAGGSIVLNISNDIFEQKSPSRSLYVERLVLALHDRLGLSLMDRWPWVNMSKPPAPTQWACVNRYQLCSAWEPVYWFTSDPTQVRSDNRRVLQPHTTEQKKLMEAGGDNRVASYADGAYRLRGNAFSRVTKGRIPKNVIHRGHRCADTDKLRLIAKELGLPPHPAMFPTDIPDFAIRFLTEPGELVVDPFSGSNKTGLAAERAGRRWIACDYIAEYVRVQAEMFTGSDGFWLNPAFRQQSDTGNAA